MNRVFLTKTFIVALTVITPYRMVFSQSVGELISLGDVYDQKFEPTEALKSYLPAEKQEPKNVSLILRIARQYRHLMADTDGQDEKMKLAGVGLDYAERAVELAPNEPESHLSVAISYVKMVPCLCKKEQMEASRQIKCSVDKALALNPDLDLAWHILGCWHQRLANVGMVKRTVALLVYGGLPAATNEDAVKCFEKAIRLNPDRLIHYIELGRTYAQMGRDTEARQFIKRGLAMPNVGKDDPDAKQRGRETLENLP